jgi:hypothetical protein
LIVPIGVAGVLTWAALAAANDDTIESYNVAANVAHRIAEDDGQWLWLEEQGMPDPSGFEASNPYERQSVLGSDPAFRQWSLDEGPGTYARFLLWHPMFTLGALRHMVVDGGMVDEALVDHPNSRIVTTPGVDMVWPREASWYTAILCMTALVGLLLAFRLRRLDRRWILPCLLAVSSVPHAMLAYHASPFEIARHGVILALTLVVASWWLIALVADAALAGHGHVHASRHTRELDLTRL